MRKSAGMSKKAVRGTILHCISDPWQDRESDAVHFIPDGILIVKEGRIVEVGPASELLPATEGLETDDFTGHLIVPGFVDVHLHYAQTRIIGSFGRQLLEWLQTYTFPEELKFRSKDYADEVAAFFFQEMFRYGTTTVQSFATTHPHSVEAFFEEACRHNCQVLCGLTGIDREGAAPDEYRDTPTGFYEGSKQLLERFHEKGRCLYSIAPRFAFGSTAEQLRMAGKLAAEHPDCWIQTHLSENPAEVASVLELFPDCNDYLGVYEKYGLVREKFMAGHSIYLSEDEFQRMGRAGASIAFCPASNLFLGSGCFQWDRADHHGVLWGLGCDSGGGNTMSALRTLDDAYKVGMLQVVTADREKDEESLRLSAVKALFASTLGSARSLHLQDRVGSLEKEKDADFVVLDTEATPLLAFRSGGRKVSESLESACHHFFGLMMLWAPEVVKSTYVAGRKVFQR